MKTRIDMQGDIAHLILDDPEEKLNTLGREMLAEIATQLKALSADAGVKAVVIRSPKKGGFIAGANIRELQAIAYSPEARKGGYEAAKGGQALMDLIEDFPKPVVAAVHGACLGGGLELALACHARVVADSAETKLGLPEIKLGIVPGFGGTWRLPRLIGLARALPAILASSNFDGRKALTCGLADLVCPQEYLEAEAHKLAQALLVPGKRSQLEDKRRATLPLMMACMEWPLLKGIVYNKARAEVISKTGGHYPAPLRLISHLKAHRGLPRQAFLEAEANALADTLATPVAQNLIRIFFLSQDAKKQMGSGKPAKITQAAVVGAGFMGSSIAIPLISRAQVPTFLKDANEEVLGRALKKIWGSFAKRLAKRQMPEVEARRQFNLATPITRDGALHGVSLVIEAVPEIMELKKKIFAALEAVLPETAVLASNTSTLPIRDLSSEARHPERFIGMHFFSPAELMPLVEVIPGPKTSQDTVATVVEMSLKMGKTPVVVKDSPGFLVNRILLPYILEAVQMVEEGIPVAKVDAAALAFGMPVGPIKLMGEVGIEVIVKVFHILQEHFGDHLPKPSWIDRSDLASAFTKDPKGKLSVHAEMIQGWVAKAAPEATDLDVSDRLFHSMLNEASRCMQEGIVPEPGYLDLAMIFGTGFPAFRGGLLREADARGLENTVLRGKVLSQKYGAWLQPPQALQDQAAKGGFYN
jgi:3-hydroxyacyl-CoA dehydrogenase/enoyl-CoA hydratase/3-hydroxybutyryl-CoA epimerase